MRILFGVLAALGDVVYNTAIARRIRKQNATAEIHWAVLEQFAPVLYRNPSIDKVLTVKGKVKPIEPTWEKVKLFGAKNYDKVVLPQIYPDNHARYADPEVTADYLTLCAENAGISLHKTVSRKPFVATLAYLTPLPDKYFTVSHVSFTREAVWPSERYEALAALLPHPLVALCRPGEPVLSGPNVITIQDASINQVAWIIERSEGFLGLDSGLTAVAASTEVPWILTIHTDEDLIFRRMALIYTKAASPTKVECIKTPSLNLTIQTIRQLSDWGTGGIHRV